MLKISVDKVLFGNNNSDQYLEQMHYENVTENH